MKELLKDVFYESMGCLVDILILAFVLGLCALSVLAVVVMFL